MLGLFLILFNVALRNLIVFFAFFIELWPNVFCRGICSSIWFNSMFVKYKMSSSFFFHWFLGLIGQGMKF